MFEIRAICTDKADRVFDLHAGTLLAKCLVSRDKGGGQQKTDTHRIYGTGISSYNEWLILMGQGGARHQLEVRLHPSR